MTKFKNKKSMLALYNKQGKNGKLRDGVDYGRSAGSTDRLTVRSYAI